MHHRLEYVGTGKGLLGNRWAAHGRREMCTRCVCQQTHFLHAEQWSKDRVRAEDRLTKRQSRVTVSEPPVFV